MSENSGEKFFHLAVEILISNRFILTALPNKSKERGYDLVGKEAGEKQFPIAIKYYRTERAQPSLIAAAAESLIQAAVLGNFKHAVLVVSCVVEPPIKISLEKRFQIRILDKLTLLSMALSDPKLYDSLIAIDESNAEVSQNPEIPETKKNDLSLDELNALNYLTRKKRPAREGSALSERLRNLAPGIADSFVYEALCLEILRFLFNEYLKLWVVQNRTKDELHRFDLICSVSPRNAFWSFVECVFHSF